MHAAFGEQACFLVDRDATAGFEAGRVDQDLLKRRIVDWNQHLYFCGPPSFNDAVMRTPRELGAQREAWVFEQ